MRVNRARKVFGNWLAMAENHDVMDFSSIPAFPDDNPVTLTQPAFIQPKIIIDDKQQQQKQVIDK